MKKHYILNIDPQAEHYWDRCTVRNPITGEHPDFNLAIAEIVGNETGSYLIKLSIEVEVLEQVNIQQTYNHLKLSRPVKSLKTAKSAESAPKLQLR